jgi:hypothetical protein
MIKKYFIILVILISGIRLQAVADEGMWLPMFIEKLNYADMKKMGLTLTSEQIYSVNNSSLKDAIVQFGGGCTAELISSQGLLITNHHCGYGNIQSHSTVDHDYLTNGFWAKNKSEELPNEGLTVSFLVKMEDVTSQVLSVVDNKMREKVRNDKITEIIKKLTDEAIKGTTYKAVIRSFYDGNEYFMFIYEVYKDIRLVGAPPSSIGKYGADTDNWMWPRHTGDFSMFRVYTGPDGKPADYSKDNIPMVPKHYLPISIAPINNNDFAMILGYPGSTDRFLTSYGISLALEQFNPAIVKIRGKKLELMKQDMDASSEVRIKYASKYAGIANYWKYFIGQSKGLKRLNVYDKKKQIEDAFKVWVNNSDKERKGKYDSALIYISDAYKEISKYTVARVYYGEAILRGPEIITFASRAEKLYDLLTAKQPDKTKIDEAIKVIKENAPKSFKNYNAPTDKRLTAALFEMFYLDVPKDQQPDIMAEIAKKYKNDFNKYADFVFSKSIFCDETKLNAFLEKPSVKILKNDPAFIVAQAFNKKAKEFNEKTLAANYMLNKGNRLFVAGLREMYPDTKFYPNANSTMRLTYGKVMDYTAADAVHFNYYTTLDGVMEKEDPNNWEFVVPAKLKELYKNKDYGRYAENGVMKTCFITNNDITGGNSGSPVLNGNGELIGLAFDGNWEAMSGNIAFEPDLQRCINVDIRYVLFIIDKYAGATNLIDEMTIVDKYK